MSAPATITNYVQARQTKEIVDVGGAIPLMPAYEMLGNGGAATISGFFTDQDGYKVGLIFSGTVPAGGGTPTTFPALYVAAHPTAAFPNNAFAFIGAITGNNIFWDTGAGPTGVVSADFTANYASCPQWDITDKIVIGSVG